MRPPLLIALLLLAALPAQAQNNNNGNAGRAITATPGGNNQNANRAPAGNASGNSSASGVRQYRNNTQLGDALIQIDPESRSLVIVADEDTHGEIMKVIKNLDRPKPQVLIKVLFAQVTLDDNSDIGVEGSYAFNVGQPAASQLLTTAIAGATAISGLANTASTTTTRTGPTANGGTATTTTNRTVPYPAINNGTAIPATNFGTPPAQGALFTLNTQNASATLFALAQKGKVNVLSRPSILARNNQEAVIVVGQQVPIPAGSAVTSGGNIINNVSYQDVGIILRVTPFITVNHTVEMIVSPEISSLSAQTVQVAANFNAPIINKTSAETVVVTPDATTVVIGGLMQRQESSQVNKVPLLGDIPLLGNAFKRTTKTSQKTELVIFMTPYIVEGTDHLEELSIEDLNRTDLPKETLTPRDVSQYLDDNLKLFPPATPAPVKTTTTVTKKTTRRAAEK